MPKSCSSQEKYILRNIVNFIDDQDNQIPLENVEKMTETELTTLFANHLFGRLAASLQFTIDHCCAGKRKGDQCLRGKPGCKLTGVFGDTSIGNTEVCHGNLDIIVNDDLAVATIDDSPDSPGQEAPVEVKIRSSDLSKNSQIIAERIVFSFFQKQKLPEKGHFLFPCIGIGNSEVMLMFYDSEHDVLLESVKISLFSYEDGDKNLNPLMIIVIWLVVNHKYLCSGLTDEMKMQKSSFFVKANGKLHVYENELRMRNVCHSFKLTKKIGHKKQLVVHFCLKCTKMFMKS